MLRGANQQFFDGAERNLPDVASVLSQTIIETTAMLRGDVLKYSWLVLYM